VQTVPNVEKNVQSIEIYKIVKEIKLFFNKHLKDETI